MLSSSTLTYLTAVLIAILFILVVIQQRIISSVQRELAGIVASSNGQINKNNVNSVVATTTSSSVSTEPSQQLYAQLHKRLIPGSVEFYLHTKSPPNKPSIPLTPEQEKVAATQRTIYGGKGDALHLGGFTDSDYHGISPNLWNFMLGPLAVRSLVDVGCGKGVSTSFFLKAGADVLCVEGSHDAVMQSLLPARNIVEHDFSQGPWWPAHTYDAAWSVEFLEHVGRHMQDNYMGIFKKSALIFVTSSAWGGFHHVEVHEDWWWQSRFEAQGFVLLDEFSKYVRDTASADVRNGEMPQHITTRMNVYVNPKVASLPKHKHLFGGNGCFMGVVDNRDNGMACTGIDALPLDYQSLLNCEKSPAPRDDNWRRSIKWKCVPNPNFNHTNSRAALRSRK